MWLLRTDLNGDHAYPELKQVSEQDLEPPEDDEDGQPKITYAILSHRWEEDGEEISFDDIMSGREVRTKKGWFKLRKCCQQAQRDGFRYAWIDTCCIDKRSSAELQEAINSMYHWYERAAVCYAYLRDVTYKKLTKRFRKSEWFTRGWTLQELLAPNDITFFDRDWTVLGNKSSMQGLTAEATSIRVDVLSGETPIQDCSVAERMSWASWRRTSRVEDRAYSLLGIFGINMPMLYGEGDKAFLRLQEEILKRSDDNSIFAWSSARFSHGAKVVKTRGLLAISPDDFSTSGDTYPLSSRYASDSYTITNRGLSIHLAVTPYALNTYFAPLDCSRGKMRNVGIFLRLLPTSVSYAGPRSEYTRQFQRVAIDGRDLIDGRDSNIDLSFRIRRPITVPQIEERRPYEAFGIYGFRLSLNMLPKDSQGRDLFLMQGGRWRPDIGTITVPHGTRPAVWREIVQVGHLIITDRRSPFKFFAFAFTDTLQPIIFVSESLDLFYRVQDSKSSFDPRLREPFSQVDFQFTERLWLALRHRGDTSNDRPYYKAPERSATWVISNENNVLEAGQNTGTREWWNIRLTRGNIDIDGVPNSCWDVSLDR